MKIIFSVFLSFVFSVFANASIPCGQSLCRPSDKNGLAQCAEKAEWIIDGEVIGISHKWIRTHDGVSTGVELESEIIQIANNDTFRVVKGESPVKAEEGVELQISAGSSCWQNTTFIDRTWIGQRIRFFGSNNIPPQLYAQPGFFAFASSDDFLSDDVKVFISRMRDISKNLELGVNQSFEDVRLYVAPDFIFRWMDKDLNIDEALNLMRTKDSARAAVRFHNSFNEECYEIDQKIVKCKGNDIVKEGVVFKKTSSGWLLESFGK